MTKMKNYKTKGRRKLKRDQTLKDFHLIPDSAGIILNGIFLKNDNSEIIIKSAFGGQWHFRQLKENESSL